MTFDQFGLNKQLLNAIEDAGYERPSEIQEKAIPQIMAGHDILGVAQTGTGKTAAFLLPLLMKIKYAQGMNPRALILAPTRELAMQIAENIDSLAKYTDIRYVTLYGGLGPKSQIEAVQKGTDIIVATPGRFLDIYLKGELVVKDLKTMVLDEADKMMDMGFMPQIRKILEVIPRKRQNLLFSATMPDKVLILSEEFLEFPMRIEVTPQATPAETVKQVAYHVPNFKTKINLLEYFLKQEDVFERVIIFVRDKATADNVFKFIERKVDSNVRVIHANKGQNTRINSMEAFKSGDIRILVSTDVTARGIDVTKVSHVINFDVPVIYEDYVHRIGRTARAGLTGEAITFVTSPDVYHIAKIEKIIRMEIPVEEIPEEVEIEKTPFVESQEMAREIDEIKRRENPDFKGAFHEKKKKYDSKGKNKLNFSKSRGNKGRKRR